ncbi:MAG: FHA domain-containing protein [Planctomycetes bacterium]|nr:FHA domain-containing protein [Planctomycetota bacterium]
MANYVLEILDGDRAGEVLPVAEQPMRIGRKPGNDVVLADEKTSGVHCEIVREGDRHVLRDLGSTNGTFLDGKRVTELVLTPGDVVTVGRLRVKFRAADGAAGDADAGNLAVHRLDAGRLKKRGGSMGLVAVLLLLVLGGGGWYWWQGRNAGGGEHKVGKQQRAVLQIAGNKLGAASGCEDETGWTLAAAGAGFQPSTDANTGRGAFVALRAEGSEAADFAVATLAEPLPVFAGRTFTIAAHVQSSGGAAIGLRALCFSNNDAQPFRFRTGTALAPVEGWQRLEVQVTVPGGCDRMQIELVATLPGADANASFDDVAATESGAPAAIDQDLAESNQKAFGTGAALAVRSTDADNPVTLLEVLPGDVPAAFAGLAAARLLALSDVGAKLAVSTKERSFGVAVTGADALELVFPAEAAGNLLGLEVAGGAAGKFESVAADSTFTARGVLVGDRATRALVQFAAPVECRGKTGNGLFRLRVAAAEFELVLGFRNERQLAGNLLREAKAAAAGNQPGNALNLLRELAETVPQDSALLGQAQELRAQLLTAQADAVVALGKDFDEAEFFDTRGGFERVVAGLDELVALYGKGNLEGAEAIAELRGKAQARLDALDAAVRGPQQARLTAMAKAFTDAQQPALAKLVQDYVKQYLEPK